MAKNNSKKPASKAKAKQEEAVESRIQQLHPEILAQINKAELASLKEILRVVKDANMTLNALNATYNKALVAIRDKYDLPADVTIDDETGIVRSVTDG